MYYTRKSRNLYRDKCAIIRRETVTFNIIAPQQVAPAPATCCRKSICRMSASPEFVCVVIDQNLFRQWKLWYWFDFRRYFGVFDTACMRYVSKVSISAKGDVGWPARSQENDGKKNHSVSLHVCYTENALLLFCFSVWKLNQCITGRITYRSFVDKCIKVMFLFF